ncbi:MAG: ATP-binding protein [Oscillospiraceae bacterium]|nr:ATP-binding protein [Oscillospiraceae bacterium]
MGLYLNPSDRDFETSLLSEIYVDKSGIIAYTNKVLNTQQKYVCISRPRRFGKTMTADMLTDYYIRGYDSSDMFANLKIANDPSYKKHLNKYNVIFLNMQDFLSDYHEIELILKKITDKINIDVLEEYPNFDFSNIDNLPGTLQALFRLSKIPFIFIIDEWDCIFRVHRINTQAQEIYLDFLRNLLKDRKYVALAYMTGILPIKKYGTHSTLNMFREFSMTRPREMAEFVGFTQEEVIMLCTKYKMDYEEMSAWYNGYSFPNLKTVYNPKSVVEALISKEFSDYWSQTETFEALSFYINIDYNGLKDAIIELLAGAKKQININNFANDMITFKTYEDVLTLLIHLGYLGYDFEAKEVFIPNKEISEEFVTAIRDAGWEEIKMLIKVSDDLLKATWNEDAQAVAEAIDKAHTSETSIIKYNDENALSCVLSIAYYSAREYYIIEREQPSGKGFADLFFRPRKKYLDKPAMLIELKWDKSAKGAIQQIEDKKYTDILKDYKDNALLIGINYDKDSKYHECIIRRYNVECK